MSKLDFTYIKKIAEDTWEGCHGCDENDKNMRNTGFHEGATYILTLDLPVKFLGWYEDDLRLWSQDKVEEEVYDQIGKDSLTYKEWYQYWLDNVFKIE